jgi:hypothetical protein
MNKNKTRAKARGKRRVKFVQIAAVPGDSEDGALFLALDTQGRVFCYSFYTRHWARLTNDNIRELK